jgi:hypothetical protein
VVEEAKGNFVRADTNFKLLEEEVNRKDEEKDFDPLQSAIMKDHPYMYLGFGLNHYRRLMVNLIFCSILATILLIPTFKIFASWNSFGPDSWQTYTLGNFGFANQMCDTTPLVVSTLTFSCSAGTI